MPVPVRATTALVLVAACGGGPPSPSRAVLTGTAVAVERGSVLRLPRRAGEARLHRLPDLAPTGWSVTLRAGVATVAGLAPEGDAVAVLDEKRGLGVLDLPGRRLRPLGTGIRLAAVAPDGVIVAADTAGRLVAYEPGRPVPFRERLSRSATALVARPGTEVGALQPSGAALDFVGITPGGSRDPIALPAGRVAASYWADVVGVAVDSVVILADATGKRAPEVRRVRGGARDVAFSPSGHRLYVARDAGELVVLNRYADDVIARVDLPGAAARVRPDSYGRWVLVASAALDSAWVVDAVTRRYAGSVATPWADDLPAVAGDALLLVRRGADVVALDLDSPALREVGRVAGGAADLWLAVAWAPGSAPALPPAIAVDSLRPPPAGGTPTAVDSLAARADSALFLQLSSSRNVEWANDLAARVRASGLPASVLPPRDAEDPYRVVVGPYATREEAETAARGLVMPSFVITVPAARAP